MTVSTVMSAPVRVRRPLIRIIGNGLIIFAFDFLTGAASALSGMVDAVDVKLLVGGAVTGSGADSGVG